jgi:hypothetical protein
MEIPRDVYYLIATYIDFNDMPNLLLISRRFNKIYTQEEFYKFYLSRLSSANKSLNFWQTIKEINTFKNNIPLLILRNI